MVPEDLHTVGIIGCTNLSVLATIILWRSVRFIQMSQTSLISSGQFRKKLWFHLCLFMAPCLDLPMYSGFVMFNDYKISFYAFHRLSAATLFIAYSITVYDWSKVLQDIEKDAIHPFMGRRIRSIYYFSDMILFVINVIFMSLSLSNFIYIFVIDDLNQYLESYLYVTALFVQVIASLLVTCYMLYSGVKLYIRILGVTGALGWGNRSNHGQNTFSSLNTNPGVSREFRTALRNLNAVMATCSLCIFIQMMLLILNYALGYSNRTSVYVGPFFFYWTFYSWLPLWGPISALLYLSRNGFTKQISIISTTQPLLDTGDFDRNVAVVRVNSSSTTEDNDDSTDSKLLSDERMIFMMNGGVGDTSSGNNDSGSIFFAEEILGFHASDASLSYMHGQSTVYVSSSPSEYHIRQGSGSKEYIVNTPPDSDEKIIHNHSKRP